MTARISEHEHQALLVQWARINKIRWPELEWFHAIPNGAKLPFTKNARGQRYSPQAQRLKKEGLTSGIPDTCLPVPRAMFHGLYMELKAEDGEPTPEQINCIRFLNSHGYFACICYGFDDAVRVLEWYLELPAYYYGSPGIDRIPAEAVIP